jgi:uncharacterized protein
MSHFLFLVLSLLIMIVGLAGTLLPVVPGIPLIYFGYVIYGLASHWTDYGQNAMIFWGIVTILMVALDYYAGALGAKKYGASAAGIWGSIIGGILGVVFLSFIGLLIGPFLGAVAGELLAGKSRSEAWRSGWGAFVGFLAGSLVKIVVGISMIGTFLWWVIF